MEIWHQAVDGRPGRDPRFFDWPITEDYCRAFGDALKIPVRFQWREGGLRWETLKENQRSQGIGFELRPGGLQSGAIAFSGGKKGTIATRLKFPAAVSMGSERMRGARWCTPHLKIDVCRQTITNLPEFKSVKLKLLVVTGERRQESKPRAKLDEATNYLDPTFNRTVHQWRAVLDYSEADVWGTIEKWRIRPHPAYYLGFHRVSCMTCIFALKDQWATIREMDPERFDDILGLERQFGYTIQARGDIESMADKGKSFLPNDRKTLKLALSETYPQQLINVPRSEKWKLPGGAFKKNQGGPT